MARLRLLDASRNLWLSASSTLTPSTAAVGLPAAATQHPDRTYVWRSTPGVGVHTLDIDLGSVLAVSALAVANVKLVGAGVLEFHHRGDAGAPGAESLLVTLPTMDRDTRVAFAFDSSSHRHFRLKFTNPGAANDYAELGYVHLGTYFEPPLNPIVPAAIPRVDPSVASLSVDGQATFARRTKYFAADWKFEQVPEATLDSLRALYDALGTSGVFFQVLDTALTWTATLARLGGRLGVEFGHLSGRYTVALPWEEVR